MRIEILSIFTLLHNLSYLEHMRSHEQNCVLRYAFSTKKTFTINANPGQCTCCDTLHDHCAGMEGVTSGGGGVMSY